MLQTLFLKVRECLTLGHLFSRAALSVRLLGALLSILVLPWDIGQTSLIMALELLLLAFLLFVITSVTLSLIVHVTGLWQAVCQVEKVFWHTDCAQELIILGFIANIIIELIHKYLLTHANNSWHLQNLLTSGPQLCLNLNQTLSDLSQIG